MAAPTIYKWSDAGAPQVKRGNEADYLALFQAVLIDGYGAKSAPGAGTNKWTIPFSDAGGFVLKQGGTSAKKACLRFHTFSTSTNSYARMDAADDFSDISTPVNQWDGFNTSDTLPLGYANNASYNIPWIIFATERVLICQFGYNNQEINVGQFDTANSETILNNHQWYFGDYKCEEPSYVNNQICIHTRTTTTTVSAWTEAFTSITNTTDTIKRLAATYNDAWVGEVPCYELYTRPAVEAAVTIGSNRTADYVPIYPNPLNGGLYLEKYRLVAHGAIMGELYGVLIPIQRRPFPSGAGIFTFSGQGDYTGEDITSFSTDVGQYMIRLGDWGVE